VSGAYDKMIGEIVGRDPKKADEAKKVRLTADRMIAFRSQWHTATIVAAPTGGSVIDAEARAAIGALIAALQAPGLLGTPTPSPANG